MAAQEQIKTDTEMPTVPIFLIIIIILPLASPMAAQVIEPDSVLSHRIDEALQNNPDLAGWEEKVEAAGAIVPQAGAWPDPILELGLLNLPSNSFDFNKEPMTGARVMIGQMVPLAGKPTIRTDIARYNLEATQSGRQARRLMVAESIAQIWYDWAYQREALRTLNTNIDLLDDLLDVARRKYETGRGMQQDILRAETRRTELEDKRAGVRQMILTTGRRLSTLLGREPSDSLQPPHGLDDNFTDLEIERLEELLFAENPVWKLMEAKYAGSKSREELARRNWWPDLKLGAAYSYRQDAENGMERADFLSLSAGVTLPLYGKRKQGEAIREMQAKRRETAMQQRALELDLKLKLERLLDEDRRLERQITLYLEGVEPQAEATLSASSASYSVGKADFEALLMAETMLYKARLERLARVRDRLKVRASLAALIGGDGLLTGAE